MLDIDSRHHNQPSAAASSLSAPTASSPGGAPLEASACNSAREHKVDDAASEIAALLATAYQRYAELRLVRTATGGAAVNRRP